MIIDYDQYYQISEILAYFGKVNAGFHTSLKGNTFAIQEKYQPLRNEKFQFRALTEQVTKQWDHTVLKFEHILSELLHDFTPSPKLQEAVDALRAAKKPVLVLYPGSSINASFRRWDLTNYIRLIQEYQDQYTVVVAGGSDETELKKLLNYSVYYALDLINKWSLIEWGWIFKNTASIFIGNDGGLLHLADSQDVPTVGVFGPALYRKWGSISKKSTGVEIDLECRPCLQNYIGIVPQQCHRGDLACLQRIEVHQVI